MTNPDDLTVWLLILACVMFVSAMAVLIYALAILLEVRHKVRTINYKGQRFAPTAPEFQERI
jgi:hypothetical protein